MIGTMFQTSETLIRPNWKVVGVITMCACLFLSGFVLGRSSVEQKECEEEVVPFATLEDMAFLVGELRGCKKVESDW